MWWWLIGMLAGCGGPDRVAECNQLVAIVNPTIQSLAAAADYEADDYAAGFQQLQQMKARAAEAAAQSQALAEDLRDEAVRGHAARYAELCGAVSSATGALAVAMRAAEDTTARVDEMDRALQEAVDGVMGACAAPGRASICAPVMEALVKIPETLDDEEAVTAHIALVAATRGSSDAVDAAIDTFTGALGSALALHSRIRDIQQQADDAHSRMEEASAEQARIVEAINADCQG